MWKARGTAECPPLLRHIHRSRGHRPAPDVPLPIIHPNPRSPLRLLGCERLLLLELLQLALMQLAPSVRVEMGLARHVSVTGDAVELAEPGLGLVDLGGVFEGEAFGGVGEVCVDLVGVELARSCAGAAGDVSPSVMCALMSDSSVDRMRPREGCQWIEEPNRITRHGRRLVTLA